MRYPVTSYDVQTAVLAIRNYVLIHLQYIYIPSWL